MRDVVIVSSVRTAVGKSVKARCVSRVPTIWPQSPSKAHWSACRRSIQSEIEDVIMGCAMPEAEQGMNVARISSLRAGLPVEVSAMTINRFCSSGLQAISWQPTHHGGRAEIDDWGGVESMPMIPMGGHKVSAQSVAGGQLSRRVSLHGPHRGAAGAALWHHPRAGR